MTKAVRVHKVGGPEALVYEDVEVSAPGAGEVRIRERHGQRSTSPMIGSMLDTIATASATRLLRTIGPIA